MKVQVHSAAEAADLILEDAMRFDTWADASESEFSHAQDLAAFYAANQRQFGYKAGVNSGHGKVEAVLPQKLVTLLDQQNPGWMDDEKEWNRFINGEGKIFKT